MGILTYEEYVKQRKKDEEEGKEEQTTGILTYDQYAKQRRIAEMTPQKWQEFYQASGMDAMRRDFGVFNTFTYNYLTTQHKPSGTPQTESYLQQNAQWRQTIQKEREFFARYKDYLTAEQYGAINNELDYYDGILTQYDKVLTSGTVVEDYMQQGVYPLPGVFGKFLPQAFTSKMAVRAANQDPAKDTEPTEMVLAASGIYPLQQTLGALYVDLKQIDGSTSAENIWGYTQKVDGAISDVRSTRVYLTANQNAFSEPEYKEMMEYLDEAENELKTVLNYVKDTGKRAITRSVVEKLPLIGDAAKEAHEVEDAEGTERKNFYFQSPQEHRQYAEEYISDLNYASEHSDENGMYTDGAIGKMTSEVQPDGSIVYTNTGVGMQPAEARFRWQELQDRVWYLMYSGELTEDEFYQLITSIYDAKDRYIEAFTDGDGAIRKRTQYQQEMYNALNWSLPEDKDDLMKEYRYQSGVTRENLYADAGRAQAERMLPSMPQEVYEEKLALLNKKKEYGEISGRAYQTQIALLEQEKNQPYLQQAKTRFSVDELLSMVGTRFTENYYAADENARLMNDHLKLGYLAGAKMTQEQYDSYMALLNQYEEAGIFTEDIAKFREQRKKLGLKADPDAQRKEMEWYPEAGAETVLEGIEAGAENARDFIFDTVPQAVDTGATRGVGYVLDGLGRAGQWLGLGGQWMVDAGQDMENYVNPDMEETEQYRYNRQRDYSQKIENAGKIGKWIYERLPAISEALTLMGAAGAAGGLPAGASGASTMSFTQAESPLAANTLSARTYNAFMSAMNGFGTKAWAVKNAGLLTMSGFSAAGDYAEHLGDQYSPDERVFHALAAGAAEYATEKLFGGNPLLDDSAGAVTKLVYKAFDNETIRRIASSTPVEWIGEGFEEVLSSAGMMGVDYAMFGESDITPKQFADDFSLGVLSSLIMIGGSKTVQAFSRTDEFGDIKHITKFDHAARSDISALDGQMAQYMIKYYCGDSELMARAGMSETEIKKAKKEWSRILAEYNTVFKSLKWAEQGEISQGKQGEVAGQDAAQIAQSAQGRLGNVDMQFFTWDTALEDANEVTEAWGQAFDSSVGNKSGNEMMTSAANAVRLAQAAKINLDNALALGKITQEEHDNAADNLAFVENSAMEMLQTYLDRTMPGYSYGNAEGKGQAEQAAQAQEMPQAVRREQTVPHMQNAQQEIETDSFAEIAETQEAQMQRELLGEQDVEARGVEAQTLGAEDESVEVPSRGAENILTGGNENVGAEQGTDDGGKRDAGLGAVRQAGAVEEGTGGQVAGGRKASGVGAVTRYVASSQYSRRSAAEIGVYQGSTEKTVIELPQEVVEQDAQLSEIRKSAESEGAKVVFFAGDLKVKNKGSTSKVEGLRQVNRNGSVTYYIKADKRTRSAAQIYRHEYFHGLVSEDQILFYDLVEELYNRYEEEQIERLVGAYVDAFDGIYGEFTEDMTYEESYELKMKYLEELFADVYAGIKRGNVNTSKAQSVLENQLGAIEAAKENRRATRDTRGAPEQKYSFAGKRSRTADTSLLARAEKMLRDGADKETVRQETGWFQGYDGKWRYEIDDSAMQIDISGNYMRDPDVKRLNYLFEKAVLYQNATESELEELDYLDEKIERRTPKYLDEFIRHDALFEAYPELRDIEVHFTIPNNWTPEAIYYQSYNEIAVRGELRTWPERLKSVLLHEIQHAVQTIEGLNGGANISYWEQRKRNNNELDGRTSLELYRDTAGEVEARDTQARRTLTLEERKNIRPDIDRNDVVFVEEGGLPQGSENIKQKFSLSEPVEQTRELIAVHNLTEGNLEDAYEAGELLTAAELSERGGEAGEISLVFDKDNGEAPQRAVGFDEVRAAIIPDNMDNLLRRKLELSGLYTVEYPAGDEQARLEALNDFPELRFSVDDSFESSFDDWFYHSSEGQRRRDGGYLKVGDTSDVLKSIGMKNTEIRFMKSKIQKLLDDHPELDPKIIKEAPYIMENPLLVMKSATRDGRIVMIGENIAKNGERIFLAVNLNAKHDYSEAEDFAVISSAHGRSNGKLRNLILGNKGNGQSPSEILYVAEDKNRAKAFLNSLGVQFPSEQEALGSVGRITYQGDSVKIEGPNYYQWLYMGNSQSFSVEEDAAELDAGFREAVAEEPRREIMEIGGEYDTLARKEKLRRAQEASLSQLRSMTRSAEERLNRFKWAKREGVLTEEMAERMKAVEETVEIDRAQLKARNAEERKAREKAKQEKVKAQRPQLAKKNLKAKLAEIYSIRQGSRKDANEIIERAAEKMLQRGRLTNEDRTALLEALYSSGLVNIAPDEYYSDIRAYVQQARIYVPEAIRAEFGDDWESFRRRAWGNRIYLTANPEDMGIDVWTQDLAQMFPGGFSEDTDLREQLEQIVALAEEGKAENLTLGEMMERNRDNYGWSVEEQMDELEGRADAALREFAEQAKLEIELRQKSMAQLIKERKHFRGMIAGEAQRRNDNTLRSSVMKQIQQLQRMRRRADPETRAEIDAVLRGIDTVARRVSARGLEDLPAIAKDYEERKANDPNFIENPYVEARIKRLNQIQLDDMDIEDVAELGRIVCGLVHSIQTSNKLLAEQRDKEVSEAATEVESEISATDGTKGGKLYKWLAEEHISPVRFLNHITGWRQNGTMHALAQRLEDGQTRMLDYLRQATQIFDGFLERKENKAWMKTASGKDADWITVKVPVGYEKTENGAVIEFQSVDITPMMRVSLLMHSKNGANLRHIELGGITIPNKELYRKGKIAEAYAKGTRVKMRPETVRAIVSECTPQEIEFAGYLKQYYDQFSKDRINEVSMLLDGFERAGGENYYHIKTDRKFLAAQPEAVKRDISLESIGSIVNERRYAGNPIVLEDASDALTDHMDQISKYYGFAVPIRDFNAVMNYTFHEKGNAFSGSVKETLGQKWGAGAQQYIDRMLADLQQSTGINEMAATILSKFRGRLAGATLMFNPSVAVSQTASYPGAMQTLGLDGLLAGLKIWQKVDTDLIQKYSPLLWYRNQGNSTQELGDYMSDQSFEKKLPWLLGWIQKMDSATIRRLWAAAEYRVSKDTDLSPGTQAEIDAGTDEYYQKVAEVFNRAVYDTQPNYTAMQRPQILRSKSDLTRAVTMFKTVPIQYYNMMFEATGRLRAAMKRGDTEEIKSARKYFRNTMAGILAANTVYVAMKALFKALRFKDKDYRDKKTGEYTWGSVLSQLGLDLAETYAGSIVLGTELFDLGGTAFKSLMEGGYQRYYGTEVTALSWVTDAGEKIVSLFGAIGDGDTKGIFGSVKGLAKEMIKGFVGLPVDNMETYLLSATKWAAPEWAERYENLWKEKTKASLSGESPQLIDEAIGVIMDNRTENLSDENKEEVARLYMVGLANAVPSAIPTQISYTPEGEEKVEIPLSAKQREAYREAWSNTVSEALPELLKTEEYESADDEEKAEMIAKLYKYAGEIAKNALVPEAKPDRWVTVGQETNKKEDLPIGEYIAFYTAYGEIDGKENGETVNGLKGERAMALLDSMGWSDAQEQSVYTGLMASDSGKEKSDALMQAGLPWDIANDIVSMQGSNKQKMFAIIESGADEKTKYAAAAVYASEKQQKMLIAGEKYGVKLSLYAEVLQNADSDGNDSISQEEAMNYIMGMNIPLMDMAYLWQMVCDGKEGKSNPFSPYAGEEFWNEAHKDDKE